jgi:hypothetical protein
VNGPSDRERKFASQHFGGVTGVPFTISLVDDQDDIEIKACSNCDNNNVCLLFEGVTCRERG